MGRANWHRPAPSYSSRARIGCGGMPEPPLGHFALFQRFENAFEKAVGAIDPPRHIKDRDDDAHSEREEYPAYVAHLGSSPFRPDALP